MSLFTWQNHCLRNRGGNSRVFNHDSILTCNDARSFDFGMGLDKCKSNLIHNKAYSACETPDSTNFARTIATAFKIRNPIFRRGLNGEGVDVKVLLMVSALNGLSQRVWCALERYRHDVSIHIADRSSDVRVAARAAQPDLILCPFLKAKVPEDVWTNWTTIIIHPGPVGDRGPSSLDWAISEAEPMWGVTALQAVDEMDAGPIWASRTFVMPEIPLRKSAIYNGRVADAAMECIDEVLDKVQDPTFTPTPLALAERPVASATLRPSMTQAERAFSWDEPTDHIVRQIRAADGSPGVRTTLLGLSVHAYDAEPGRGEAYAEHAKPSPGQVLCHTGSSIHVRTGDGSVWLGHLRATPEPDHPTLKLPATTVLRDHLSDVPRMPRNHRPAQQIQYRREVDIGWLSFDFYNGAMSTHHCGRLLSAVRHATSQDTRVLVLQGSTETFSNGIHLNVIEAAEDSAREAWSNIKAINAVCKQIISCRDMTIIAAFNGSAGAGGVMLGLGAHVVAARGGVVLNPYYDMGLFGSELHTYTLPRRVGAPAAQQLLEKRRPVDTTQALSMGLVDAVGPRDPDAFQAWLSDLAGYHASEGAAANVHSLPIPLDAIEVRELAEMSHDMFDDRSGFAAARRSFVHKTPRQPVVATAR